MVINFGTGPAKIPEEVLLEVQKNLLDFNGTGMSITEISHRSKPYIDLHQSTIDNIREILDVPSNFKILLTQGGGNGMFSAACLNLMGKTGTADYVVTGFWSQRAAEEAKSFGNVNFVLPKTTSYKTIPPENTWKLNSNASFVYYCDNETVDGIEFNFIPRTTNNVPLVCDMSSNFFSKKIDFSKFGVVFAAAHKGNGTAGVTVTIVREDLIGYAMKTTPSFLNFEVMSKWNSNYNTPPIFSIYILHGILEWIKKNGGLTEMHSSNREKCKIIYDVIDECPDFYFCLADKEYRSYTTVPFRVGSKSGDVDLEKKFLEAAQSRGMIQLNGHMTVGGIRVALYNSITIDDLKELIAFMKYFYKEFHSRIVD